MRLYGLSIISNSKLKKEVYKLVNGKRTSIEIAKILNKEVNQISNILLDLLGSGLIKERERKGKCIIYEKDPDFKSFHLERYKGKPISVTYDVKNKKEIKRINVKETKITRKLINFKGKYPMIFFDGLEDEINLAYNIPKLPNATLLLTRKLIENLVYCLLEYKFQGTDITIYYNTRRRMAQDFKTLLDNLKTHKEDFEADQIEWIEKFLELAKPFRKEANKKTHKIMEYLDNMDQLKALKINDMVQILLKLIDKVK